MTITAKILADSMSPVGSRLTTFELEYPRFIHSQMLTHRVFSRNTSSSRAIPVDKVIQHILDNPIDHKTITKNMPGMSSNKLASPPEREGFIDSWYIARSAVIREARKMNLLGIHKQHINRILEPFTHIKVVLTGTEYRGFFTQRISSHAQPEIEELAIAMFEAMENSEPRGTMEHLPYIKEEERDLEFVREISVARCARVSYRSGGKTHEEDLKLFERLINSGHWSPLEHVAVSDINPDNWDNLKGWRTLRNIKEL